MPLTYDRRNGNMWYREDKWYIQIPSIVYSQKNESEWGKYPPLNIENSPLPQDIKDATSLKIPQALSKLGYNPSKFTNNSQWTERKETRIRDKFIRIKIRYSGKDLVVLYALLTLYTQSYV